MKLKDQVCSLSLAKKLKDLGVKQKSLWYWEETKISEKDSDLRLVRSKKKDIGFEFHPTFMTRESISAFTVAELGKKIKPVYLHHIYQHPKGNWYFDGGGIDMCQAKIEANIRAKVLIFILKKLLK